MTKDDTVYTQCKLIERRAVVAMHGLERLQGRCVALLLQFLGVYRPANSRRDNDWPSVNDHALLLRCYNHDDHLFMESTSSLAAGSDPTPTASERFSSPIRPRICAWFSNGNWDGIMEYVYK